MLVVSDRVGDEVGAIFAAPGQPVSGPSPADVDRTTNPEPERPITECLQLSVENQSSACPPRAHVLTHWHDRSIPVRVESRASAFQTAGGSLTSVG
jgi:hypothetical protein